MSLVVGEVHAELVGVLACGCLSVAGSGSPDPGNTQVTCDSMFSLTSTSHV